jgi:predicted alpha-1,2-mannosidase
MNPFYSIKKATLSVSIGVALMAGINNNVCAQKHSPEHLTSYVDPYIGAGGHGHVFVGASVPFGAVQLGPDNLFKGWDYCSGYNYADSLLIGFAHTHLSGTGIGDLADVLIMPYTGGIKIDKGVKQVKISKDDKAIEQIADGSYASHYSHKYESVKPGYYSVKLLDYNINVELTATERVGFHRYHFPEGKEAHVIIDLKEGINSKSYDTYIKQVDQYTIEGYRKTHGWAKDKWIFFAIKSSVAIPKFTVYNDTKLLDGNSGQGESIKGLISFDKAPSTMMLKVGISPVSSENALDNINAEIPDWNFEKIVKQADDKWNKELSTLKVETSTLTDKRVFYTSLYHTMIDPSTFNDHNGDYRGTDKKVYKNAPFTNYSVFSLWDTYRAANPLYILTQPKRASDMINSMLAIYDQQGALPIWHLDGNETGTMVGISSMQVVSEAWLKGIKGIDAERAYNAIKTTANSDLRGLPYVRNFEAIPYDKGESRSVGKGLEYSISDGSTALMAKKLHKMEDYAYFLKRSQNYKQYYDPKDKFLKGKKSDGSWITPFSPTKSNNNVYAEGNAWQYLWLVPQDVKGLISLLGGEKAFNTRLDSLFIVQTPPSEVDLADLTGSIGQYAHGNEPSHHIAYLYAFSGQQWKTAEKVRYIMKNFYPDNHDGVIGNEDCGQMSAWYIFSAMGFYPVFPASGVYVIGSPVVKKATIKTTSGKPFIVQSINNGPQNIYVQSIMLNGKKYNNAYITHEEMMKGGTMKIMMGSKPNYNFGKLLANRP